MENELWLAGPCSSANKFKNNFKRNFPHILSYMFSWQYYLKVTSSTLHHYFWPLWPSVSVICAQPRCVYVCQRRAGDRASLDVRVRPSTQTTTLFVPGFRRGSGWHFWAKRACHCRPRTPKISTSCRAATCYRQLKTCSVSEERWISGNPGISKWTQTSCVGISTCKCMIMYQDRTCGATSDVSNLFYSKKRILSLMAVFIFLFKYIHPSCLLL